MLLPHQLHQTHVCTAATVALFPCFLAVFRSGAGGGGSCCLGCLPLRQLLLRLARNVVLHEIATWRMISFVGCDAEHLRNLLFLSGVPRFHPVFE